MITDTIVGVAIFLLGVGVVSLLVFLWMATGLLTALTDLARAAADVIRRDD